MTARKPVGSVPVVRAPSTDVLLGYALELLVSALRGLRLALRRLIGDDDEQTLRPRAAWDAATPVADTSTSPCGDAPAADTLRGAFAATPPLPERYGDDRLVLVARDLHTLFVSWDLAPDSDHAPTAGARLVLRIEDLSLLDFAAAQAWRHDDLAVDAPSDARYVSIAHPAGTYRAELGWQRSDGTFIARVRSAIVTTARADAPGHDPLRWGRVERAPLVGDPARLAIRQASAPSRAPATAPISAARSRRAPSSEEQYRRGG